MGQLLAIPLYVVLPGAQWNEDIVTNIGNMQFICDAEEKSLAIYVVNLCYMMKTWSCGYITIQIHFLRCQSCFLTSKFFPIFGLLSRLQPHTGWSELSGSAKGLLQAVCSRLPFWLPLNKEKQQWS